MIFKIYMLLYFENTGISLAIEDNLPETAKIIKNQKNFLKKVLTTLFDCDIIVKRSAIGERMAG